MGFSEPADFGIAAARISRLAQRATEPVADDLLGPGRT